MEQRWVMGLRWGTARKDGEFKDGGRNGTYNGAAIEIGMFTPTWDLSNGNSPKWVMEYIHGDREILHSNGYRAA